MLHDLSSWHLTTIMNFTSGAGPTELLSLDNIREQLIRLEDTIIFCTWNLRSGLESAGDCPRVRQCHTWRLQRRVMRKVPNKPAE